MTALLWMTTPFLQEILTAEGFDDQEIDEATG